jgi:predicted amidohydrolase
MRKPIVVAAVQLSSQADLGENLRRAEARIAEAAGRGAELVVLPENFAFMGETEEDRRKVAEDLDAAEVGPILRMLRASAEAHGVWIVAGGMAERSADPARPYNTCAVVAPDGQLAARYRKIHLFDVDVADGARYRESASTTPGEAPVVVEALGAQVGLSICYDVRFPELYRALVGQGAEVLVVPAAFTLVTGKDHWHVLLRARAIEAQCYVVAAAQWGTHPRGRRTYGKSCIVDPWGEVVGQASEGEGVVTASLDPAYLARVRASVPSLAHRKLGVAAPGAGGKQA